MSEAMQWFNASYTRYFNTQHQRVGHLYQGRFFSNLVDRDPYLLEVTRYIHLNPFRARLVQQPLEYPWSSYRIYGGLEQDPWQLVQPGRVLAFFGSSLAEQSQRYREFVDQIVDEKVTLEPWVRTLRRKGLIPSRRWLCEKASEKVSDTFPALKSV